MISSLTSALEMSGDMTPIANEMEGKLNKCSLQETKKLCSKRNLSKLQGNLLKWKMFTNDLSAKKLVSNTELNYYTIYLRTQQEAIQIMTNLS